MVTASYSAILILLATIMGGGGNHLLDYASTDAYWKSKNVQVSVDRMLAEMKTPPAQDISQQIKDLASPTPQVRAAASKQIVQIGEAILPQLQAVDSPDPEVAASVKTLIADITAASKPTAVRRLMAARTLGELKKAEAAGALRIGLKSPQMFAPEYCARALAQIEGKPYAPPQATADQRKSDLWLLPAECRIVMQAAAAGAGAVSVDSILEKLPPAALGNQDREKVKANITQMVVMVAEQVGDVRLDAVTAGLSGDIGHNGGFVTAVVRVQYDAAAARAAIAKLQVPSKVVGGVDVFMLNNEGALIFPSNDRVIFMYGPQAQALPLDAYVKAIQTGKGELGTVAEMKKLIESVDTTQPLWGVVKMTDSYRQAPLFAAFDTITIVGKTSGQTMDLQINGTGNDKDRVAAAVDQVNAGVQQAIVGMRQAAMDMPFLAPLIKTMEGVKCSAQGEKATLAASIEGNAALLVMPLLWGVRGAVEPVAPVPARGALPPPPPPPVQVQP